MKAEAPYFSALGSKNYLQFMLLNNLHDGFFLTIHFNVETKSNYSSNERYQYMPRTFSY